MVEDMKRIQEMLKQDAVARQMRQVIEKEKTRSSGMMY